MTKTIIDTRHFTIECALHWMLLGIAFHKDNELNRSAFFIGLSFISIVIHW